jgi:MFS superfamily sulfate permease-like transporter
MRPRHTLALAALIGSGPVLALNLCPGWNDPLPAGQPRHEVFASPYTHHWSYDEEHKQVYTLSLSRRLPNDRFCGLAVFNNSFGQPSAYAFVGKTWPGLLPRWPDLYLSVSAGIIYGYVGKYKDKVPLNVGGFAPAIIPTIGYRLSDRYGLEVQLLGTAAFMVGVSGRF